MYVTNNKKKKHQQEVKKKKKLDDFVLEELGFLNMCVQEHF